MIAELRLKNNVGLLTKGTKSVTLDLADLVNIFMGRNGFGKTSILKECHPLPPDNADYAKGGYKYVKWIVSPQEFYILESHTGTSSTHSFKKNGVEELNTGGTLTVQRELCVTYFGLTPALVKYMSGLKTNNLFSTLSTAARKQLFMEMYPNDTRYALSVYNKIKAELRNSIGAIKNQHKRLAEENQRAATLSGTNVAELEVKINELDTRIKDAMVLSGLLANEQNVQQETREMIHRFIKLTKELVIGSVTTIEGPEELTVKREQTKRIMEKSQHRITAIRTRLASLMETLSGVNYVNETPEVLEQQQAQLIEFQKHDQQVFNDADRLVRNLLPDLTEEQLDIIATSSETLCPKLEQVVQASSEKVTLLGYKILQEKLEKNIGHGRTLKYEVEELRHALKHFDMAEDMKCPECATEFKPGFDIKDVEQKRKDLVRLEQQLKLVVEEYRSLDVKLKNDEEFFNTLTPVVKEARMYRDDEHTVLNVLKDYGVGYKDCSPLINAFKATVERRTRRNLIKEHQTEIESLGTRIASLRRNDITELTRQLTELESSLASEQRTLRTFNERLETIEYHLESITAREHKVDQLGIMKEDILSSFKEQGRWLLRQATDKAVAEWVPAKDNFMQMLIRGRSLASVIESIELDIARLEKRKAQLQILQDNVCPNKGLIGKMMEDFIKTVCANMNAHIRQVFTTPLYILPCVNKKGDLDYNFPVINSVDGKPSKDISDCSGGEQDIINLAFRMILIRYKSKNRFPLMLDEVGVKLDAYHQQRLFDYILNISTSGDVNQILMVSHFFSHTSMFKNANVIALNSEGITVPADANQKAKFK
ncbi:DNA double-strand break repair Rad50 ATPase [Vibrio phage pTD1]|uniref:DNA double-strand break repair Rad50 ATPase n=1 Tax=Vibrio phage pTD1 TaxID=1938577 RepID=A0A1Q2U2S1_9CAUD|nr:DNA double-strand break repair Rad50 ATPase [Vibrio phage pTD1]BAW98251.1 DNA double-strand break repair Rad50 ATPase [Vibrio phage pTD1]